MFGPPYRTVRLGFDPYREMKIWHAKHGEMIDSILFSCRIAISEMAKFTIFGWSNPYPYDPICSMMLYVWYIKTYKTVPFLGFICRKILQHHGEFGIFQEGTFRSTATPPLEISRCEPCTVPGRGTLPGQRASVESWRFEVGDPQWFLEDYCIYLFFLPVFFLFSTVFFSHPNVFFGSDTRYTRNRHISSSVSWGRDMWNSSVWTWQSIWNSCAS